jgi:hypothetical protein
MHRLLAAPFLAIALLPAPAGALEPKKPSDLVTLIPFGTCFEGRGLFYTKRVAPDGTYSDFVIPEKHVLVVTRWTYIFAGGNTGDAAEVQLRADGEDGYIANGLVTMGPTLRDGGTVDAAGVVGAGEVLCGIRATGSGDIFPGGGLVEGFLAKAK